MLFDANEFLDRLPSQPLRQRLAESRRVRLGAEFLLVAGMGWLIWFSLVRIHLPDEVKAAYRELDDGVASRDPRKVLAIFPSDVTIVVDGQAIGLSKFSESTTAFLQAKEITSIDQTTEFVWVRSTNDTSLQVRAIQLQAIERRGQPTQRRRLGLTLLWNRSAAGWRLKGYNCKTLRPRP